MSEVMKEKNFDFDETVGKAVKDHMSVLQARLVCLLEEAVSKGEASASDKETIKKTLDDAFTYGQVSDSAKTEGKKAFENISKLFEDYLSPETEKYKRMCSHQHSVTSSLLNVALNMLIMLDIQNEKPRSLLDLTSSPCLGFAGMPMFEKELKP